MNLPIADYTILYNNKNITTDISAQVISIDYTDKITGESDELEIKLEDVEGHFIGDWYPAKGDKLQLNITANNQQLNCGVFTVDELEASGSRGGSVFTIKALAAGITKKLRTKNNYAHANKTLGQIASTIAQNMGLTLVGTVQPIQLAVANQYRETDLQFLNRLGSAYGYVFSVRDTQLVFVHYSDIENKDAVLTFTPQDLVSYSIKDSTVKVFKSCRVRHHNPETKQVVSFMETYAPPPPVDWGIPVTGGDGSSTDGGGSNNGSDDSDSSDSSGDNGGGDNSGGSENTNDSDTDETGSIDQDEHYTRVENEGQAQEVAKAKLHDTNSQGVEGDIAMPGNPLVVSGNNIKLTSIGKLSGTYHITEAKHTLSRDNIYQTTATIKRVKK